MWFINSICVKTKELCSAVWSLVVDTWASSLRIVCIVSLYTHKKWVYNGEKGGGGGGGWSFSLMDLCRRRAKATECSRSAVGSAGRGTLARGSMIIDTSGTIILFYFIIIINIFTTTMRKHNHYFNHWMIFFVGAFCFGHFFPVQICWN